MARSVPVNLADILRQTPTVVALLSPDGTLVYASKTIHGVRGEHIIGRPSDVLLSQDDKVRWRELVRRVVEYRETVEFVIRPRVPSTPGFVTMAGTMSPFIRRGRVRYVVCVSRDVTFRDGNPFFNHMLTPLGRCVVKALLPNKRLKSLALATACNERKGRRPSAKLRAVLADLVERDIVRHGPEGYAISAVFLPIALDLAD